MHVKIVVAAAVIERDGCFLVTKRQAGVHLEGYWEFPGGKCEPGETIAACVARELREELDVDAQVGEEVFTTAHVYPDRAVELHFLNCAVVGRATAAGWTGDEVGGARGIGAPEVSAGRRRIDRDVERGDRGLEFLFACLMADGSADSIARAVRSILSVSRTVQIGRRTASRSGKAGPDSSHHLIVSECGQ